MCRCPDTLWTQLRLLTCILIFPNVLTLHPAPLTQDVVISDHGTLQRRSRLLRLADDFAETRYAEELPVALTETKLHGMLTEHSLWPGPTFNADSTAPTFNASIISGLLPLTAASKNVTLITEANFPNDFCINLTLVAPSLSRPAYPTGQSYEVIAVVGGDGDCGNFFLFIMHDNKVGIGVQKIGNSCNAGGSDDPIATEVNLTEDVASELAVCYVPAQKNALLYINNQLEINVSKNYVFPRSGCLSFFVGSHTNDMQMLANDAELESFTISAFPTTTTTTTTIITTSGPLPQPVFFYMKGGPRTNLDQRAANITEFQWPADFCISINITSSPYQTAGNISNPIRTIAALGGSDICESFIIYFTDNNRVGMGTNPVCKKSGSSPNVESSTGIAYANHWISFCYSGQEAAASIIVDREIQQTDRNVMFDYSRQGFVTYLGGAHQNADSQYELLQEAKLWSLEIVECTPNQMPYDRSQIPSGT